MTKFRTTCLGAAAVLSLATSLNVMFNWRAHAGTLAAQSAAAASGSATIAGKVYFRGQAPRLRPLVMSKDPVCESEQSGPALPEDGRVNPDGTLPNAFLYISKGTGNLSAPVPSQPVTITQKECRYEPHVLGIMVGQPLRVVTLDPTTHNIHIVPKSGHDWDVSQQPGSDPVTTKLTHPEIMVPVHCNIHPWMAAHIGVVTNPYYAVSGDDGAFEIKSVPPGSYTLSIWTATFGTQERPIMVRSGETTSADFTFTSQ
jgi:plastocyanin